MFIKIFNNKKGQWAHAMARNNASLARENRRTYARAMRNLGFDLYEITAAIGVSSNTVRTYLRETEGVGYSDLFDFCFKSEIFVNFTKKEQDFLSSIRDAIREGNDLSEESERTFQISQGNGITGWIHKHILKDCDEFGKRNEEINSKIRELNKRIKKASKEIQNSKKFPHIAKSNLQIKVDLLAK